MADMMRNSEGGLPFQSSLFIPLQVSTIETSVLKKSEGLVEDEDGVNGGMGLGGDFADAV